MQTTRRQYLQRLVLGLGAFALAFGVTQYPRLSRYLAEEKRQQQEHLRMLATQNSKIWVAFANCPFEMDLKAQKLLVTYSSPTVALSGTTVTLGGFMMPTDTGGRQADFILSRRAPSCPFCPPGEMNELVEIQPRQPVPMQEDLAYFRGRLELLGSNDDNIFFRLADAQQVAGLTSVLPLESEGNIK